MLAPTRVDPDVERALAAARVRAYRGDVVAQFSLGAILHYAAAYVWFSLAASQAALVDNRKGLLELRNIAAARMTPEAVADAALRVAAWKPVVSGAR